MPPFRPEDWRAFRNWLIFGGVPILISLWYGLTHQALIQALGLIGMMLAVGLFVWIVRLFQKLP
jgi:hypothetical protein